jgi:hypothetical protein
MKRVLPTVGECERGSGLIIDKVYEVVYLICRKFTVSRPRLQSIVKKTRLGDKSDRMDLEYWLGRPPSERIAAVELLRKEHYGSPAKLQGIVRRKQIKVK